MKRSNIHAYIAAIDDALSEDSGERFGELLRITSDEFDFASGRAAGKRTGWSDALLERQCGVLEEPYHEILLERCKAVRALANDTYDCALRRAPRCLRRAPRCLLRSPAVLLATHIVMRTTRDYATAYEHYAACFSAFTAHFENDEGNWLLPALAAACRDLRVLACAAETQLAQSEAAQAARAQGKAGSKLEDAARLLNRSFQRTVTDRAPLQQSKKWGALSVINALLQLYFRLHNVQLGRNPLRAVDAKSFPPLERFPISQQCTFAYYRGRMALISGDIETAARNLQLAFERQPRGALRTKRRALIYLVPARLSRGECPPARLLEKYDLLQYSGIVRALRAGNVRAFNAQLEAQREFFVGHGVYLILEKLKLIAYRNLTHRVQLVLETNKLPLRHVTAALQWLGDDIDADEVECLIANLICQRHIKGYLSHQHNTVVLSSNDPFPKQVRQPL